MMQSQKIVLLMAIAASFMLVGVPAQGTSANEQTIGVVDYLRAMDNAPRLKKYVDEFADFNRSFSLKLAIQTRCLMLDEAELKELVVIESKTKPAPEDTARIKALIDTDRSRDDDLRQLQETKNLNDEQKARMKGLKDRQQKSREAIDNAANEYYIQRQNELVKLWGKVHSEIKSVVDKVAKDRKLAAILPKDIVLPDGTMMNVVYYGGVDVTDDIISKLGPNT